VDIHITVKHDNVRIKAAELQQQKIRQYIPGITVLKNPTENGFKSQQIGCECENTVTRHTINAVTNVSYNFLL